MLYSVHLFLGNEFDSILETLGKNFFLDESESLNYCSIYRISETSGNKITGSQLQVNTNTNCATANTQSVQIGWTELTTSKREEWTKIFVDEIYNKILTADKSNQLYL